MPKIGLIVKRWLSTQPKLTALRYVDYVGSVPEGVKVDGSYRLRLDDIAKLTAARDELTMLIAWIASKPGGTP